MVSNEIGNADGGRLISKKKSFFLFERITSSYQQGRKTGGLERE